MIKSLMVLVCTTIITVTAFAQNFEGTMTFGLDYLGSGISAYKAMLPDGYTYNFKGGDLRFSMNGGMAAAMMGDFVYKGKEEKTYMLKPSEKKAYIIDNEAKKAAADQKPDIKVEKTGEKADVLGYNCDKYKVVVSTKDGELTQFIWATTDIKYQKPKKSGALGAGSSLFVDGVDGFPLKMQMAMEMAGMSVTMVMEATKIDKTTPDKALFDIPSDYKQEPLDLTKMGF